jgi:hypothetical protein
MSSPPRPIPMMRLATWQASWDWRAECDRSGGCWRLMLPRLLMGATSLPWLGQDLLVRELGRPPFAVGEHDTAREMAVEPAAAGAQEHGRCRLIGLGWRKSRRRPSFLGGTWAGPSMSGAPAAADHA